MLIKIVKYIMKVLGMEMDLSKVMTYFYLG